MKVYVISSGSYSDYEVEAIVATKEIADAIYEHSVEDRWGDYNEPVEFEVLTEMPERRVMHSVEWREGRAYDPVLGVRAGTLPVEHRYESTDVVWPWSEWELDADPDIQDDLRTKRGDPYIRVRSTDLERARKIVADRVGRFKAEREGIA